MTLTSLQLGVAFGCALASAVGAYVYCYFEQMPDTAKIVYYFAKSRLRFGIKRIAGALKGAPTKYIHKIALTKADWLEKEDLEPRFAVMLWHSPYLEHLMANYTKPGWVYLSESLSLDTFTLRQHDMYNRSFVEAVEQDDTFEMFHYAFFGSKLETIDKMIYTIAPFAREQFPRRDKKDPDVSEFIRIDYDKKTGKYSRFGHDDSSLLDTDTFRMNFGSGGVVEMNGTVMLSRPMSHDTIRYRTIPIPVLYLALLSIRGDEDNSNALARLTLWIQSEYFLRNYNNHFPSPLVSYSLYTLDRSSSVPALRYISVQVQ